MPRHRVGISVLPCVPGRMGGHENFIVGTTRALLRRRCHHYTVFVPRSLMGWWSERLGEADIVACDVSPERRVGRIFYEQLVLPRLARARGIDLMFFPNMIAPSWGRPRAVVSIMDLLSLWEPQAYPWPRRLYHRLTYWRLARRAAHIVTISEFCKADICGKLALPPERVTVAYCGLDLAPSDESAGAPAEPYLLSVAAPYAHKELSKVVAAYEALASERPTLRLLLAGTHPGHPAAVSALRARVDASPARARITFVPPLPWSDLTALYRGAAAYVSASRFEGFGIPVVEAMSVGCPVAAAPAPAVVEILGGHGFVATDHSAGSLLHAIRGALDLSRAERTGRGAAASAYARAKFTWDAAGAAVESALTAAGSL